MKKLNSFLMLFVQERSYLINGVYYTVGAGFEPTREGRSVRTAMEKVISGNMVDLMDLASEDTISSEYVCSAAGKED